MGNTVSVLMRRAPYGTVYAAEGLRSLLGIGVFELDVSVVFVDDGVYVLVDNQDPAGLDMKPLDQAFSSLPEFGVDKFYVHSDSLRERGLTPADLVIDAELVDDAGVARLLESSRIVLPF